MSYLVLARKWRPKNFKQVLGQAHIVRALENSLKHDTVGHSFLFTGTRGVGKTSLARILAKAVNCQSQDLQLRPCLQCPSCDGVESNNNLDVIEIDAASNNGVDQIRDLIDNAQYLAVGGGRKVYIVDEVHMLSMSAFNALLKILEEPPPHVLFILATTEVEKVPATIQSRCQRFDFKEFTTAQIEQNLRQICEKEGIKIVSDAALLDLCELSRGSARDSLSLLEQILSLSEEKIISDDTVAQGAGVPGRKHIEIIYHALLNGQVKTLREEYQKCLEKTFHLKYLANAILAQAFEAAQSRVLEKNHKKILNDFETAELIWIYEELDRGFVAQLNSLNPERSLLLLLIKVAMRRQILSPAQNKKEREDFAPTASAVVPGSAVVSAPVVESAPMQEAPIEMPVEVSVVLSQPQEVVAPLVPSRSWDGFLASLLQSAPVTAANLEQGNLLGEIKFEENRLQIVVAFSQESQIFFDYLSTPTIKAKVDEKVRDYFQQESENLDLRFVLLEEATRQETKFLSKADEFKNQKLMADQKQRDGILNHPLVIGAEKVFNTKVDKVVLNNEENV